MGTSKSYGGPKGKTSLLPPWAPPPPPLLPQPSAPVPPPVLPPPAVPTPAPFPTDGQPAPVTPPSVPAPGAPGSVPLPVPPSPSVPDVTWAAPKRAIGRFVGAGGSRDAFKPVARSFVRAQGGARRARQASSSGITVARRLAGVLTAVAQGNPTEAIRFLATDVAGRSADEVLAILVDSLAPGGAQNEEAAARSAACTVLGELFESYAVGATGLDGLASLTTTQVAEVVIKYVATYIFARLMQVLAVRLERGDIASATACRMERDVRDYVQDRVSQALVPAALVPISFTAEEGQGLMEQVFEDAYSIIESWQ
jgi:hypothetical protein